jgi:hypothetical protein
MKESGRGTTGQATRETFAFRSMSPHGVGRIESPFAVESVDE